MNYGAAWSVTLSLLWLVLLVFVVWRFYKALARIGEELAEIKTVLRDTRPSPPN